MKIYLFYVISIISFNIQEDHDTLNEQIRYQVNILSEKDDEINLLNTKLNEKLSIMITLENELMKEYELSQVNQI